jgi:hypothetical protein
MNKRLETNLLEVGDVLETFVLKLENMTEEDMIDIAARLKPVAKACKTIDESVKTIVKTKLKHKEGTRYGGLFKAVLKLVATKRLDQSQLKENEPEIYEEYLVEATDERVTFELR